ncbi:MAG: DUF1844 domain-containing protein [Planctomycetota bacterium]
MSQPENEGSEQEPKIIVDSDWKEQVAKEREAAEMADEPAAAEPSDPVANNDDESETPPPPPASYETLVSMLFTQALAALGQIPDPTTGEPTINKTYAKHYIDTLEMLGEKTKGNLTDAESKLADEALHALRMTYVNTQ